MGNVSKQVDGLLRYVNEQTNREFDKLGEAVKWLVDEYKSKNKK